MKRKLLYILVAAVSGTLAFHSNSFSQKTSSLERVADVETLSSVEWQKTVDDAKKEIKDLLRENERLTAEYDFLKGKLSSLQSDVLELKQKVEGKARLNEALAEFQRDQIDVRAKIQDDMKELKRGVADVDGEKQALLLQMKEEEKKNEMWTQKLSDMQVKKRELTLELKLQEISRQELEQGQDEDLERLKEELGKYQEKGRGLEKELRSLKNEVRKIPPQSDEIILKNKELELKIERSKVQHQKLKRMNEEIQKRNDKLKRQAEEVPGDLLKEKKKLEAEIQKLEDELAKVKTSIQGSAELIQKKRQLMNEIMQMDTENQELRKKIDVLMSKRSTKQ